MVKVIDSNAMQVGLYMCATFFQRIFYPLFSVTLFMVVKSIIYFEKCGKENTKETLEASRRRADELNIKNIVIATTRGSTALVASETFNNSKFNIVAVNLSYGVRQSYGKDFYMTSEEKDRLVENGVTVFTGLHALGHNVGSSFRKRYRGESVESVVQDTLYRFCVGMKVCVEIVLMAADAGLIPVDEEVIAIGGTGWGADTSVVVRPACSEFFHELEIREIIAKPREAREKYEGVVMPASSTPP